MDYRKSKVKIACAGAGKTYSMAEEILKYDKLNKEDKDIIAITYTNNAKDNIYKNIFKQKNIIPEKIKINTIHSFLLEYIIYPYSNYVLSKTYTKATSIPLSPNVVFKNKRISELEKQNIIHNDKVFNLAKQIVVPSNNDNVQKKEKKKNVLEHIKACISAIFIDESQDLDNDCLKIMEYLGKNKVFIYMIGDTKQALKYPKVYDDFVQKVSENKIQNFEKLPNNNITRRLPKTHVMLSNLICIDSQKQKTKKRNKGTINYIYTDDPNFTKIYNSFQNEQSICYIKRKSNLFNTHSQNGKKIDSLLLNEILINKNKTDDEDAFLYEKIKELYNNIEQSQNISKGLYYFAKNNNIYLSKINYAKIASSLEEYSNFKQFNVLSIDKIKGLEKENCMFILDDSLLEYLFEEKQVQNKEKNYLYVGLTRSTNFLLLVVDNSNLKKFNKLYIDMMMKKLNIEKYNVDI